MNEHPIEGLMITAMNSIKDMIDVNTIIGDPIESKDITIIPISKVSFGFAAGGSEFTGETVDKYTKADRQEQINYKLPFGGGAGAGVSISPIAFVVINNGNVKLIPVNHSSALDKLLDYVPDLIEKTSGMIKKCLNKKENEMNDRNTEEDTEADIIFEADDELEDLNDEEDLQDDLDEKKVKKESNTVKKVTVRKKIKKPENKTDMEDD